MHDLIYQKTSHLFPSFSVKFFSTLLKHNWMRLFVSIWSIIRSRNQIPACLPIAYPFFSFFFQVSYNEYTVAILSFFLPLSNTAINAIYRHTCNVAKIKHVHIKIGLFWFKFFFLSIFSTSRDRRATNFQKWVISLEQSILTPWLRLQNPLCSKYFSDMLLCVKQILKQLFSVKLLPRR